MQGRDTELTRLQAQARNQGRTVQGELASLEEDRTYLPDIVNSLPFALAYLDKDGRFRMANTLFLKWFGLLSSESIFRQSFRDIFAAPELQHIESLILKGLQGEKVSFSMPLIMSVQEARYIEFHLIPYFSKKQVKGLILILTDQSQQKAAETRIRELSLETRKSQEQLDAIFSSVTDGIALTDMEGRFIFANAAQARISGYSTVGEMLKESHLFSKIFELHTLDGKLLPVEEWPMNRVRRGEILEGVELHGRRNDRGQEWYFSFSGRPIFDTLHNQYLCVIITRDITSKKLAENIQRESLEQFKTLANSIPQMVWMAYPDGKIFWFNERWYNFTGFSQSESITHGWNRIIDPTFMEETKSKWVARIKDGKPFVMEFPLRGKDGIYRWFLTFSRPIVNKNGEVKKWFGTCTDIDEQRRVQDILRQSKDVAEAANEAKSRFLANMSHELRTPMTAVLGFAELLRDPHLTPEERRDALERIDRSGRTLLRLIDDVLDISKIEAGKMQVTRTHFSTLEVITEVTSQFKTMVEQKGLKLKTLIKPSVPEVAYSDPGRLRQILTNIVGNAVKFTQKGEIVLTVSAEDDSSKNRQYLIFEIADTGIGISDSDQDKLFHPFAQADESITRQFGGTGLGLVLSKRLAEELGGNLTLVKSELTKGSCFRLKVEAGPFKVSAIPKPNVRPNAEMAQPPTKATLKDVRVLLVEDAIDNQVLLKRYLESVGATVELAGNGEEALKMALQGNYHIILMDIQLPKMDGIQATKHLRSQGYVAPILALTAHALPEEIARTLEAGCNEHITKPVTRGALVEAVSRWVHYKTFQY